jgi:hypothetical protein
MPRVVGVEFKLARVCYVIIAHDEPANLLGLIASLWNPEDAFLVWIDGKADQRFVELARAAVRFGDNVHVRIGSVMVWGGFSIVNTTLTAYSQLRAQVGQFSHVVLCSGTHVPLLHPDAIFEKIQDLAGWIDMVEVGIPEQGLSQADAMTSQSWWWHMLRRIRYRYVEVPAVGMIVEGIREAWNGSTLLEGSQWHVLRSDLADFIVEHEGRIREAFHDVVVADEHAFQWIVAQSPTAGKVRRGKIVWVDWEGASPKRVGFSELTKRGLANQFLFARKAASDCTIDGWSEWAGEVLSNSHGADRLRQVAPTLDWASTGSRSAAAADLLSASREVLLQSLVDGVSRAFDTKIELECLSSRRYLIATGRHLGGRGPVSLICAVEPGSDIAVIPAVRRPPPTGVDDSLRLQPGLPGLPDFVNLAIGGRVYWPITKASDTAQLEGNFRDAFAKRSHTRSRLMTVRKVDNRTWIAQTVQGRSFADVGGLWGTVNERVSDAILQGAREASMLDIAPLGHSLWKDFDTRCTSLGVSGYKCISVDATSSDLKGRVGSFDVVHCSGVIYHVPDLVAFVRNLLSITTRHLILQSMVVPARIKNKFGVLDLSGGHCLFVPLLNEKQRKIAGKHLEDLGLHVAHLSGPPVGKWIHGGTWNYIPWSWLITPDFLRGLVQACGLSVVDEGFVWEERTYSVFCEMPNQASRDRVPTGFSEVLSSVDSSLVDLSLHKRATQSSLSEYSLGATVEEDASGAVSGHAPSPYAFHTNCEANPWWSVDLEDVCSVRQVVIFNRSETDYLAERAIPLLASTSLDGREWSPLFKTPDGLIPGRDGNPLIWTAAEPVNARFLRLSVGKSSWLHLRQVRVLGLSKQLPHGSKQSG